MLKYFSLRKYMLSLLNDLYVFQMKLIEEELVIFVCATTGQGDEPDNMKVVTAIPYLHFGYNY